MHRIIFPVLLIAAAFAATSAYCQPALLYTMPNDTTVPPLYVGQPATVTAAYLWLDELMRDDPEYRILGYIRSLSSWNDTTQTLASYLYQIQDDNPLSYYDWNDAGIYPHVYKGAPGQSEFAFIKQMMYFGGQCNVALLSSEIIADVTISDTVCKIDPSAITAKDQVLVNCVINDEIKGKWVPGCPLYYRSGQKGASTFGVSTPVFPALPADTASAGTCLLFNYSPEWKKNSDDDLSPTIGWWIKPGQEYIVFLSFNATSGAFSTWPVSFGHCCGMYPVVGGIVQDPYDDLNLGGTNLSVSAWKTALRAKIKKIVKQFGQLTPTNDYCLTTELLFRNSESCKHNLF